MSEPVLLPKRAGKPLTALAAALLLAGCSSLGIPDLGVSDMEMSDLDVFGWFEDDEPQPDNQAERDLRARGDAESAAAADRDTPQLSSVPARPQPATSPSVRQRVVEGLISDRENARYTDDQVRLQGTSRAEASPAPAAQAAAPAVRQSAPPAPARMSTPATQARPAMPEPVRTPSATVTPGRTTQMAQAPRARVAEPAMQRAPIPAPAVQVDPSAVTGGSFIPASVGRGLEEQVATIQFAHNSSSIDQRDRQVLSAVVAAQRQNGADILVVGHASSRTQQLDRARHELVNFRVSLARANAVADVLIGMGVDRSRLRVEAIADSSPIFSEAMPTGEAGNRRAEVYFIR